jgi:hypothetical protein
MSCFRSVRRGQSKEQPKTPTYRKGEEKKGGASLCVCRHGSLCSRLFCRALSLRDRRVNGYYSCTCPTWKNLAGKEQQRTCAHLKALLGNEYEEARTEAARSASPTIVPSSQKSRLKKRKEPTNEEDVFPMSSASQSKKPKSMYQDFNERANYGPRDFNGGVSGRGELCSIFYD